MPTSFQMFPPFEMSAIGMGTAAALVKFCIQSGTGDALSASKAYTLSYIVAMYTTLCGVPDIITFAR